MAKFLNTRKAVSEIEDLIRNAGEKLILISPYLKISNDFKELLEYRNKKDKVTTVIYRNQTLNPDEMKFLQGLRFLVLKYNEHLHAKCYINDDKMIITSLNLYEFSMANNKEMGVLVDKNDATDKELFEEAYKEIDFINETSQRFDLATAKVPTATLVHDTKSNNKHIEKPFGYCIRTGIEIPFNIEKPMSYKAYESWSKYGDMDYPEKYCHFSGEFSDGKTSVNKPILSKNWKKAKEIFNF